MYTKDSDLYIAHCADGPIYIEGKMANRHGLIAGATGTGKTVSLQVLAETFSQAGVPCFMADMKGDLSGISQKGSLSSFIQKRCVEFGIDPESLDFEGCPTAFFDVYGEQGHPIRARVDSMGPALLARLLELNDVQTGVLTAVFRIAKDENMQIIDLKDLRAMLDNVSKNAAKYTTAYGNISASSVGAIQRSLLALEDQGGDKFFGEPEFDIYDLLRTEKGKGVMNVLAADKLMMQPKLYSTFLLWLLTRIYETMPEVGDCALPKFVFFFDEAHMLFKDTSKALVEKIEQIVRLIRSKGVGVYFITQSPADIPDSILGQLGNRVQHALRAFTPKDQQAVKVAAQSFRANPAFSTEQAITELATGEALVSVLDSKGAPSMVQNAKMLFPLSQIGAITPEQRKEIISNSRIFGKYEDALDRHSAYEEIAQRNADADAAKEKEKADKEAAKAELARQKEETARLKAEAARQKAEAAVEKEKQKAQKQKSNEFKNSVFGSILATVGSTIVKKAANELVNSIFGSSKSSKSSSSKGSSSRSSSTKKRK